MSCIERVAVVGAGGRVGGAIAKELLKTGKHIVTAVTRADSQTVMPAGAVVVNVDYDDAAALEAAFRGQQFLVISLSIRAPQEVHTKLVAAAARAGVPYIMPNYFGYDPTNEKLHAESLYGAGPVREVEAADGPAAVSMVCGFWYEWSLAQGEETFGIDIRGRRATLFDDGARPINVSTWRQCGHAVAALLSLPKQGAGLTLERWVNKSLRFDSWRVSQRVMLDSVQRVTGTSDKDWEIRYEPSQERWQAAREQLKMGDKSAFHRVMYTRIFFPSGEGDYESTHGLCNEQLGLPKEDLDEATKRTVDMVESGWNPYI